jgi:hypothetical protein
MWRTYTTTSTQPQELTDLLNSISNGGQVVFQILPAPGPAYNVVARDLSILERAQLSFAEGVSEGFSHNRRR